MVSTFFFSPSLLSPLSPLSPFSTIVANTSSGWGCLAGNAARVGQFLPHLVKIKKYRMHESQTTRYYLTWPLPLSHALFLPLQYISA